MGIILSRPGIYIPPYVVTNKDLVELVDKQTRQKVIDSDEEWIEQRTGITERRISFDKDVKQMGIEAVRNLQLLLREELKVDEVRFATNTHRDGEFPSYAGVIAAAIGLDEVINHDGQAGCTGLIYAIRDAYNAILSGEINSALVVGSEKLSDFTNFGDRTTCYLFGDAAGCYKLEKRDSEEGIIANVLGGKPDVGDDDFPRGYLAFQRMPGKKLLQAQQGFVASDEVDGYVVMHGKKVFRYATDVMKRALHEVIARSKYELSEVNVIIPHGANLRIIETAAKKLRKGPNGFKGEIFTNLEVYGNTSTASVPLATAEAIEKGVIKNGSLVVNVAFGAGFTYGANLYRAVLE